MSATRDTTGRTRYAETVIQKIALILGIVFLVVGIAGFIPGLTTDVDAIVFSGHESGALLLGVFQVSILHNIVHLLYGVAGVALAAGAAASRNYLIWGGAVYLLIWLYGLFVAGGEHPANFVPMNQADNWLHLGLGVGMILLGIFVGRERGVRAAEA
ncbi:DUF4383 domain-containing protein [Agromyces sp. SYSU K20354]|uniref:DUF4383 domain-containing protein n=1 Tax=Agromyces cavernae TaxID=2898659 RepID=UPI001E405EA5|nr:DUF4383 domain-containing protein [Agromyces cavernae]MCD2441540.1 DUF4383 domain-containing protein [Agromyces cavernae]